MLAARIAQPQYIALLEVSPEMEDALEAAEARVAAAKKEADKSKTAAARQSVRQDMRLRAKVWITDTFIGPINMTAGVPAASVLNFVCQH